MTILQELAPMIPIIVTSIIGLITYIFNREINSLKEQLTQLKTGQETHLADLKKEIKELKDVLVNQQVSAERVRTKLDSFEKYVDREMDRDK